jgi:hypothetical protein
MRAAAISSDVACPDYELSTRSTVRQTPARKNYDSHGKFVRRRMRDESRVCSPSFALRDALAAGLKPGCTSGPKPPVGHCRSRISFYRSHRRCATFVICLDLDPVDVANQGTMVVAVSQPQASRAIEVLRRVPETAQAVSIGRVESRGLVAVVVERGTRQKIPLDEPVAFPCREFADLGSSNRLLTASPLTRPQTPQDASVCRFQSRLNQPACALRSRPPGSARNGDAADVELHLRYENPGSEHQSSVARRGNQARLWAL